MFSLVARVRRRRRCATWPFALPDMRVSKLHYSSCYVEVVADARLLYDKGTQVNLCSDANGAQSAKVTVQA